MEMLSFFLLVACMTNAISGMLLFPDKPVVPPRIGFTYGKTANLDVSDGSYLLFDKAITTIGTNGQLTSGKFITQSAGTYKFQFYALTQNNTNVWLELYKNNDIVASVFAHSYGDYAATGNGVVLQLKTGDEVYVWTRSNYNTALYGGADQIYTTFTGVYLDQGKSPSFSVGFDKQTSLTPGKIVVYNKVISDIANVYDNTTGLVTIKEAGIYVIQFYSLSVRGSEIYQKLYRNTDYVCALYNFAPNEWSNGGNTAILRLAAGDTLSVGAARGYDNNVYGGSDQVYTTFNGALIAKDSDLNDKGKQVVAFTAGLSRDSTVNGGQKVVFDRVIYDVNQAYDKNTGDFTAPVAGYYEFMYHAVGQKDEALWLELYKNDQYVDSMYSHNPTNYASGGNAAVLQLDAGDAVYVKTRVGKTNSLYGRGSSIYSTFSGYLIREGTN